MLYFDERFFELLPQSNKAVIDEIMAAWNMSGFEITIRDLMSYRYVENSFGAISFIQHDGSFELKMETSTNVYQTHNRQQSLRVFQELLQEELHEHAEKKESLYALMREFEAFLPYTEDLEKEEDEAGVKAFLSSFVKSYTPAGHFDVLTSKLLQQDLEYNSDSLREKQMTVGNYLDIDFCWDGRGLLTAFTINQQKCYGFDFNLTIGILERMLKEDQARRPDLAETLEHMYDKLFLHVGQLGEVVFESRFMWKKTDCIPYIASPRLG